MKRTDALGAPLRAGAGFGADGRAARPWELTLPWAALRGRAEEWGESAETDSAGAGAGSPGKRVALTA